MRPFPTRVVRRCHDPHRDGDGRSKAHPVSEGVGKPGDIIRARRERTASFGAGSSGNPFCFTVSWLVLLMAGVALIRFGALGLL